MKNLIIAGLFALLPRMAAAQEAGGNAGMASPFLFDEVTYTPEQTTFRLFSPTRGRRSVTLRLYDGESARTYRMKKAGTDLWELVVAGDLQGRAYTFDAGQGETPGVFAKAVGVNGQRGFVVDLRQTDPDGWDSDVRPPLRNPADLVVYELHHRDFSVWRNHGTPTGEGERTGKRVASRHPGKFLALTEPWAIGHLKELGVNAVHLLPSYDFGSVDETRLDEPQYNWGYDPVNYNVPEGSYSTDPYDPLCRIREFKQMVQALHKAGIRVILDVVYNHTYDIAHSNFQRTYPDYYYRKTSDGTYSDGSGCGNETASERPMMRQFMVESVKYWLREYHIDGFRFDLMGVHDIETMNLIRKTVDEIDPSVFIYGEGWSAGTCALPLEQLATKAHVSRMPRIAAFSDELRDALRGPFSDDTQGAFLAGLGGQEESLKFGIVGAIPHPQVDMTQVNYADVAWAEEPTQMISYVSCHDDMCLTDRLRASIPGIGTDELVRLDLLAQTAVFTSQGVPFMLSGEELLRDKKGVHNSFESPDSVNHLDWSNMRRYPQVFGYYKDLLRLRKNHPAFRLGRADLVRRHLEFLPSPACTVAFRLKDHAGGDAWQTIYVLLNGSRQPQTIALPEGSYETVCEEGRICENGINHFTGSEVTVAPQSALILHDCPSSD